MKLEQTKQIEAYADEERSEANTDEERIETYTGKKAKLMLIKQLEGYTDGEKKLNLYRWNRLDLIQM